MATCIAVQSSVIGSTSFSNSTCHIKHKTTTILSLKPKASSLLHSSSIKRLHKLQVSATIEEPITQEEISLSDSTPTTAIEEIVKGGGKQAIEKPKLVLKFIWMEKNIGLGLDQELPGHGTVPLSPYFFWPRKDAWEELKTTLENKPWISQKKMIILLNQATDIINLWQQSGGNLS